MRPPVAFVTSSEGKFREASRLAPFPLERIAVDLPEPQGLDAGEIVRTKAAAAWAIARRPLIVEDTALELVALGGFPGPMVRWLVEAAGATAIPRMLEGFPDRRATARTALAYADGGELLVVDGVVPGTIVAPAGDGGFGWDPVFRPDGSPRTFAEMDGSEKDALSHRGRAFAALAEALARRGGPRVS